MHLSRSSAVGFLYERVNTWHREGGNGICKTVIIMCTPVAIKGLQGAAVCAQVTSAGQAAVLGIARLLAPGELRVHVLGSLDALGRHQDDEMRCILAELLAALGAELEGIPVEADVLPRLLRLVGDSAYLVRKARPLSLDLY
jgi:hypothetical protein